MLHEVLYPTAQYSRETVASAAVFTSGGPIALVASHRVVNERVGRLLPWVDVVASTLFVVVGVAFVVTALA